MPEAENTGRMRHVKGRPRGSMRFQRFSFQRFSFVFILRGYFETIF